AERLHRVQSNVTTRIRLLEQDLGVALFIREGKRLRLAPAGQLLLGYADQLLALAEETRHALPDSRPRRLLRPGPQGNPPPRALLCCRWAVRAGPQGTSRSGAAREPAGGRGRVAGTRAARGCPVGDEAAVRGGRGDRCAPRASADRGRGG